MTVEHIGLALTVVTVILALHAANMRRLKRLEKHFETLAKFHVEHEMLIDFYCEHKHISRRDLPTRHIRNGNELDLRDS